MGRCLLFSDWPLVTLTGQVMLMTAAPATGRIIFCPSTTVTLNDDRLLPIPFSVALMGDGSFSVALPATDTPGSEPESWLWQVTERITGRPRRVFHIRLPRDHPTVQYAELSPVGDFNEFSN
jgi:hypothetical protein